MPRKKRAQPQYQPSATAMKFTSWEDARNGAPKSPAFRCSVCQIAQPIADADGLCPYHCGGALVPLLRVVGSEDFEDVKTQKDKATEELEEERIENAHLTDLLGIERDAAAEANRHVDELKYEMGAMEQEANILRDECERVKAKLRELVEKNAELMFT